MDVEKVKRTIAVIPARKGSKRIPKKNMVPILGKPLVSYTVEAALKAKEISLICVSSDDDEMLQYLNKKYEMMMIRRPPKFAQDDSPIQDAVNHTVGVLELAQIQFDIVVILQANVILRIPGQIDECVRALREDKNLDSCVSVSSSDYPYWTYQISDGKLLYPWETKKPFIKRIELAFRRQEVEDFYRLDGAVQAIRREVLKRTGRKGLHPYLGERIQAVISSPYSNFEIDTPEDVKVGEALIRGLSKEAS